MELLFLILCTVSIIGAFIFDGFGFLILVTSFFALSVIFGFLTTIFGKSFGWLFRTALLGFSIILINSTLEHIKDFPIYWSGNYQVAEGYALIRKGNGKGSGVVIEVDGREFGYNVPHKIKISDNGRYIKIHYLPNTNIIMDWEFVH